MDTRAKHLIEQGDMLFSKRQTLMSLWQELADQFYPERADFTVTRSLGDEFSDHLMNSYPVMARRDLGNAFSGMLRPTNKEWFHVTVGQSQPDNMDAESGAWLERAATIQRRAMYDRRSQFVRATKEGDQDFAAFGQCVISAELNRAGDGLLYRCWHLRDVAWCENAEGMVDTVHRKWKPTVRDLVALFRDKVSAKVRERMEKEPYCEVNCRHIVVPSEYYQGARKFRQPYVSIYIDVDNQHVMEEFGSWTPIYVIPRWQTVSGSQYAHSPATIIALPDARLIQSITRVLLEAGERYVDPPMLAVQEAIRSDISLFAGGITWVDAQYDERLGEVLRPITTDKAGMPLGLELQAATREMIAEAFYLNKLTLPPMGGDPTAYEVGQRVSEYIRQALPIFEPLETDYNGSLCESSFDLLLRGGAFGPPDSIPEALRGQDIQFRFESPLHEAIEREKGQKFLEAKAMLAQAAEMDPVAGRMMDPIKAMRDVLPSIRTPSKWLATDAELEAVRQEMAQQQQAQQMMGDAAQVAEVADMMGLTNGG